MDVNMVRKKKTDTEKKRYNAIRQKKFQLKKVNLREEIDRWNVIKSAIGATSDKEVATALINCWLHKDEATSQGDRKPVWMRNVATQSRSHALIHNGNQTVLLSKHINDMCGAYTKNHKELGNKEGEEDKENQFVYSNRWRCLKSILGCSSDTDLAIKLMDWFVESHPLMKLSDDRLSKEQVEAAEAVMRGPSLSTEPYLLTMRVTKEQDLAIKTLCTLKGWNYEPADVPELSNNVKEFTEAEWTKSASSALPSSAAKSTNYDHVGDWIRSMPVRDSMPKPCSTNTDSPKQISRKKQSTKAVVKATKSESDPFESGSDALESGTVTSEPHPVLLTRLPMAMTPGQTFRLSREGLTPISPPLVHQPSPSISVATPSALVVSSCASLAQPRAPIAPPTTLIAPPSTHLAQPMAIVAPRMTHLAPPRVPVAPPMANLSLNMTPVASTRVPVSPPRALVAPTSSTITSPSASVIPVVPQSQQQAWFNLSSLSPGTPVIIKPILESNQSPIIVPVLGGLTTSNIVLTGNPVQVQNTNPNIVLTGNPGLGGDTLPNVVFTGNSGPRGVPNTSPNMVFSGNPFVNSCSTQEVLPNVQTVLQTLLANFLSSLTTPDVVSPSIQKPTSLHSMASDSVTVDTKQEIVPKLEQVVPVSVCSSIVNVSNPQVKRSSSPVPEPAATTSQYVRVKQEPQDMESDI